MHLERSLCASQRGIQSLHRRKRGVGPGLPDCVMLTQGFAQVHVRADLDCRRRAGLLNEARQVEASS